MVINEKEPSIDDSKDLTEARFRHHSDELNVLEAKRMVELARRQEKNN